MDTFDSKTAICAVFWLSIVIRTTNGALLKFPTDHNVTAGEPVTFHCQTNLDFSVFWYFNKEEIFYGGKVSIAFKDMFQVSTSGTGVYNLEISSADARYNGEYVCGDDEGQGERRSARLYVTVQTPVTVFEPLTPASSDNGNSALIIGVVIGCVTFLIIIIVVGVVCYCKKKRARDRNQQTDKENLHLPENKSLIPAPSENDQDEAMPGPGNVQRKKLLFEPNQADGNKSPFPLKDDEHKKKPGGKSGFVSSAMPALVHNKEEKPNMQLSVDAKIEDTAVCPTEAVSPANESNTSSVRVSNSTDREATLAYANDISARPTDGTEEITKLSTDSTAGKSSTEGGSSVVDKAPNPTTTSSSTILNSTSGSPNIGSATNISSAGGTEQIAADATSTTHNNSVDEETKLDSTADYSSTGDKGQSAASTEFPLVKGDPWVSPTEVESPLGSTTATARNPNPPTKPTPEQKTRND